MKISKPGLKQIIKEEYKKLLGESETIIPQDGKYYKFKSGEQGQFIDYGKYVEGKGFIRVEHEDLYKRARSTPYYDQGTAIEEISPESAVEITARELMNAKNVKRFSRRNY
jgi:hypothetical protein